MDLGNETSGQERAVKLPAEKVYIISILIFLGVFFAGLIAFLSQNPAPEGDKIPEASAESSLLGVFTQNENTQKGKATQQENLGPKKPTLSPTPSPSKSPTPKPSPTNSPTITPSSSPSPTPSSSSDTSSLEISNIRTEDLFANSVKIKWETNQDAEGKVEYSKDTSYSLNKESSDKKKDQTIELTGLEANTLYHYKIIAKDNNGNSKSSGDNTFTTSP